MSFPRYPEYKDSGVEWQGEVPGGDPCGLRIESVCLRSSDGLMTV